MAYKENAILLSENVHKLCLNWHMLPLIIQKIMHSLLNVSARQTVQYIEGVELIKST